MYYILRKCSEKNDRADFPQKHFNKLYLVPIFLWNLLGKLNFFPEKVYIGLVLVQCRQAKGYSTPYASNNGNN